MGSRNLSFGLHMEKWFVPGMAIGAGSLPKGKLSTILSCSAITTCFATRYGPSPQFIAATVFSCRSFKACEPGFSSSIKGEL